MTSYSKFKELHNQANPLLIGNVWNAQSAKIYEKLNFQAIGTSSAAVAHSLGYEDGEQIPFSDLLFIVERIKQSVTIPLSVDIEFGFGNTAEEIANNIILLSKLNIVGVNIEDSFVKNKKRKIKDSDQFSVGIKEIKNILMNQGVSIFLNIRCDAFLLNLPNAQQVASERLKKYEQAGADGIFLPCITKENDISKLVSETSLPLNVMCMPELPNFKTLQKLGVRRISIGNFLNEYTYSSLERMTTKIVSEESFNSLFNGIDQ